MTARWMPGILLLVILQISFAPAAIGTEVIVKGAVNADAQAIRDAAALTDDADDDDIDDAKWQIFDIVPYEDISIERDGSERWIITLVEPPIIAEVRFEGAEAFNTATLLDTVFSKPGTFLAPGWREYDPERLKNLYRADGRFRTDVEMRVEPLADGRADVVFAIAEGAAFGVRSITFPGATVDACVLKDVLSTRVNGAPPQLPEDTEDSIVGGVALGFWLARQFGLTRALTRSVYDPRALDYDRELLRRFYLQNGRVDAEIIDVQVTEAANDVDLAFEIVEGPVYRFGPPSVQDAGVTSAEFLPLLTIKEGDLYDPTEVEATIDAIAHALEAEGRSFARVNPRVTRDDTERSLSIVFEIAPGPEVWIDEISFLGLERTNEATLRERLLIAPGDPYSVRKVRADRDSIQTLSWIEFVEVVALPDEAEDKIDLLFTVIEGKSGAFFVDVGYSMVYGWRGELQLVEQNLLGSGIALELGGMVSTIGGNAVASIADPRFGGSEREGKWGISFTTGDPTDPLTPLLGFQFVIWAGLVTFRVPAILLILLSGAYYCHLWREDGSRVRRRFRRMSRRVRTLLILQSAVFAVGLMSLSLTYLAAPFAEDSAQINCASI